MLYVLVIGTILGVLLFAVLRAYPVSGRTVRRGLPVEVRAPRPVPTRALKR